MCIRPEVLQKIKKRLQQLKARYNRFKSVIFTGLCHWLFKHKQQVFRKCFSGLNRGLYSALV